MSTTTATIFIGQTHIYHGGINPTHLIQFTENSRPALVLIDLECKQNNKVVIPTLENTIDDICLMVAVYVLKKVKPPKEIHNTKRKSLYDLFNKVERLKLYKQTLNVLKKTNIKIVINILSNSHLLNLLMQIKKYNINFEVTLPSIKKEFNAWSNKIETKGIKDELF